MSEGEYFAVIVLGGFFLLLMAAAGFIGVWVSKSRREAKHKSEFFGMLDDKRERRKKQFQENMGRRYGSKGS